MSHPLLPADEIDDPPQHPQIPSVRSIKDPVHDYITVNELISTFMDTPQFQRLRAIKQLGTSYYVWPGASHNRFEHCLGVAHLARLMAEHLQKTQPELGISDRDVQCVQLAGLCHDLGHGPWSHVWDSLFIPKALKGKKWKHEDASEMMFDDLIKSNDIQYPEEDATFVKALIAGEPAKCQEATEKKFLFEIVANKRNGIDVDKFDYIARDSHSVGDKGNLSLTRLINSARVIDNQICYDIKDANQLYELCYTRFSLHKRIYNHKTAKSVEYMIVDALLAAEPFLKIAEQVDKPEKYVYLTDDIMPTIERSTEPELEVSRAIFHRIRMRDLYKCVDYNFFRFQERDVCREHITPERIAAAARGMGTPITADDVIVDVTTMHYGMYEQNPLHFINFYSKNMPNKCAVPGEGDMSMLMPTSFAEVLLRVFTKDSQFYGAVQAGYREVLKKMPSPDEPHVDALPTISATGPPTAPNTPRSNSGSLPAIGNTVTPKTTSSKTSTPFSRSNNSFTAVPLNHAPTSPYQKHRKSSASRKRDRDADSPSKEDAAPLKKKKTD